MKNLVTYHGAQKVGIGQPLKSGVVGGVPQTKGVPGPMAPVAPVKGIKKMSVRTRGTKKSMC